MESFQQFWRSYKRKLWRHISTKCFGCKQVIDNDLRLFTIASTKKFQPLVLFRDKHFEEYYFPMLYFGHPRPYFQCPCIKKSTSWINKC
jgi:hypothetical protein